VLDDVVKPLLIEAFNNVLLETDDEATVWLAGAVTFEFDAVKIAVDGGCVEELITVFIGVITDNRITCWWACNRSNDRCYS